MVSETLGDLVGTACTAREVWTMGDFVCFEVGNEVGVSDGFMDKLGDSLGRCVKKGVGPDVGPIVGKSSGPLREPGVATPSASIPPGNAQSPMVLVSMESASRPNESPGRIA